MSIFRNGRTLSCLVCPTSGPACQDRLHPLQRLISYEELLAKYARKVNRDRYDAIGIYTCPYCALDRLTVDALFEHARNAHPPGDAARLPPVYCPVCVCFRLEGTASYVRHAGGLPEHMLSRHCFASPHQYRDEFKLRTDFCCDDEFELIRFLATFLPPAIIVARAPESSDEELNIRMAEKQPPLVCPICLEPLEVEEHKKLDPCVHQFHRSCIDRWLEQKRCCPVCRCDCP